MDRDKLKRFKWLSGIAIVLVLTLLLVGTGWLTYKSVRAQTIVNVKTDAGAVGDGIADDSNAFKSAINMLSQGGTLVVPPGTYSILPDANVTISSNITVIGTRATIKARDYGFTLLGIGGSNITLSGITIEGANKVVRGITVGSGSQNVLISKSLVQDITQPTDSTVNGYAQNWNQVPAAIRIEGNGSGITINSTTVSNVVGVNWDASWPHPVARGIWITPNSNEATSRNITIQNSTISNISPKDDGDCIVLQGNPSDAQTFVNLVVRNNTFTGCAKRAVKLQLPGAYILYNKINNPFLGNNPYITYPPSEDNFDMYSAISIYASNVVVANNNIFGVGSFYNGIDLEGNGLTQVSIHDNQVRMGLASRIFTSSLIRVFSPVTRLSIQNNQLAHATWGIRCDSVLTSNTIAGNVIYDTTYPLTCNAIQFNTLSGPPTSRVKLSGIGFAANENVTLTFDSTSLGTLITDSTGKFNTTFTIPATALPGNHTVTATGQTSGVSATATFLVQTNWSSFGFDNQHTRYNRYENVLNPSNVSGLVLDWSAPVGGGAGGSPTVVNGTAYVGGNDGNLYAFNTTTGTLLWTAATGNGIGSTPAVVNGIVYLGDRDSRFYAFDAQTGATLWIFSTGDWNYDAPVVANGIVYFGSSDGHLYALNALTGASIWSASVNGAIESSSPVVFNNIVYIGSRDGNLYAFNATTGALLWSAAAGNDGDQSPTVTKGAVYIGSADGHLYAFNPATGTALWTASTPGGIKATPAVANGVLYIGSLDGTMSAFNAKTGSLLWTASTANSLYSSPLVANGVLYFHSEDGNLYAFNASGCGSTTCSPLWSYAVTADGGSSPTLADGILYVGSNSGSYYLYAFHLP